MEKQLHDQHYKALAMMGVLSFICMYTLMYSMVNTFKNVFMSVNQFYMAGLMTMPMIVIEVVLMKRMYMNKTFNLAIIGFSTMALILFYVFIRQQTGVSDKQFLKSMIPHHAGAILMCENADIHDPEIKKLCEEIIAGQQKEIEKMKSKLKELEE